MRSFDPTGFLLALLSVSVSVSLLLAVLSLGRKGLLARYPARTLYALTLLLTALLLFPWRPALVWPKVPLPAAPAQMAILPAEGASAPETPATQAIAPDQAAANPAAPNDAAALNKAAAPNKAAASTALLENASAENASAQASPSVLTQAAALLRHRWAAFPFAAALFALWAAGALGVLAFQAVRHVRFLRLVRRWRTPVPPEVQRILAEQAEALRVLPPPAFIAPCVQSPTLVGLLRPMLLLPPTGYNPQQLGLMLTHELIHRKHGHLWGKALACLAAAMHWFNPLMPRLLRDLGSLCEMTCDEAVLARSDAENQAAYVDTILTAALLARTAHTRLCSSICSSFNGGTNNGGTNQMKQLKQRLALMTPFQPRRTGAGLIALILLLALLTGSVLAGEAASTFTLQENKRMHPASWYMGQPFYDLVMSLQTPDWEELSPAAFVERLRPEQPQIASILDTHQPENRFMRHLQYSMVEARNLGSDGHYQLQQTAFMYAETNSNVYCDYRLHWSYPTRTDITVGERNRLLDTAQFRAAQAVHAVPLDDVRNAGDGLRETLAKIAEELSGDALRIWFTSPVLQTDIWEAEPCSAEQQALLDRVLPTGYQELTITQFEALLQKEQEAIGAIDWRDANIQPYESALVMNSGKGEHSEYLCAFNLDTSLMPASAKRGSVICSYQFKWECPEPDILTIGTLQESTQQLYRRIRNAADEVLWSAPDWETCDRMLKEALPAIAQEESTAALQLTVSDVSLELWPMITEEYARSSPQNALNAFINAMNCEDTESMSLFCPPIAIHPKNSDALTARKDLLYSLAETHLLDWEISETSQRTDAEDSAEVHLKYLLPSNPLNTQDAQPDWKTRIVALQKLEGAWYVLPESFGSLR